MSARVSHAQERAQALRQRLGLGDSYVDVFDVLRTMEIEVYRRPFPGDGLEGAMTIRSGVPFIFVNSHGALTRQRLTAAHELGHYELGSRDEGTEVLEDISGMTNGDEAEVFRFARHFLMDEKGVTITIAGMSDELQRVAAVASKYVVSPTVVAIHLAELGVLRPATKARLREGFDSGELKPGAFLGRYGYRMMELSDPAIELDPGHVERALLRYQDGSISLAALAEVLMAPTDEARRMVVEAGAELHPEDAPEELVGQA